MHRASSLPMAAERSRTRERLEASLAALCELQLLRHRQERLVLSALSLGQPVLGQPPRSAPPRPSRGGDHLTLRRQLSSLQSASWGLMAALEQQVADLRLDSDPACADALEDVGDSRPSSGFYELSEGQSPAGVSESCLFREISPSFAQAVWMAFGERAKSVGDIFAANRENLLECGPRSTVPRSFSVPHTSLKDIAEGTEEEQWSWDSDYQAGFEDGPTAEDFQHALRVESYILGLIQRRALAPRPSKPRTSLGSEARAVARQSSLCRKETPFLPECQDLLINPDGQAQACCGSQEEQSRAVVASQENLPVQLCAWPTPSHSPGFHSALPDFPSQALDPNSSETESPQQSQSQSCHQPQSPAPDEKLVSAKYIPGQACRTPIRAFAHRLPVPPKLARSPHSPDCFPSRPRAVIKKCRLSEERPTSKKQSRKASRSQSENSLLGQRGTGERKYSTVERDWGRASQSRPRRPHPVTAGYRRWRSTQELSQDETELQGCHPSRRSRKPHPSPLCLYTHGMSVPHRRAEYLERAPLCRPEEGYSVAGPGDTESSMSEADSPGSSSLSTDSDESGGLVWPQQLSPQQAPSSSPMQPKVFVKIKASHALKKKILRFRTGSLKVMTTV
ncbi:dapper 1-like [Scleropages formosus]|uniref:Dapper3-like n=1 Tax=Scleropages formosus TaxID=113540 RepID=A0A8C9RE84_SCLFO|nr:dapper 1-like [Scleropages formosus]